MCCCLSDSVRQGVPTAFAAILVSGKGPDQFNFEAVRYPTPGLPAWAFGGRCSVPVAEPQAWSSEGEPRDQCWPQCRPAHRPRVGFDTALPLPASRADSKNDTQEAFKKYLKNPVFSGFEAPREVPGFLPRVGCSEPRRDSRGCALRPRGRGWGLTSP